VAGKNKTNSPSFIPQKGRSRGVGGQPSVFYVLSMSVFFACLVLLGAIYGVNFWLENYHIPDIKDQIGDPREAISDELFNRIVEVDQRVHEGVEVLESQLKTSGLIESVGELTAANVHYESIDYQGAPGEGAELTMEGMTEEFGALAFQYDVLRSEVEDDDGFFSWVEVRNLSMEDDDMISFQVNAEVDFDRLSYFNQD